MAPDFSYDPARRKASRLVFGYAGEGPLAWALLTDKTDGSPDYLYPPRLILLDRARTQKLNEQIHFANSVKPHLFSTGKRPAASKPSHCCICRACRLIAVYEPFMAEAIASSYDTAPTRTQCRRDRAGASAATHAISDLPTALKLEPYHAR